METAIVTITCPSCGGKVEGIRTTGAEQTIPCSYCKTELHVPRVGEAIVRETKVVHEIRTVEATPAPVYYEPLRRRPKPILPAFILSGFAAIMLLVFLAWQRSQSHDFIEQMDRNRAERDDCSARCESQCANTPPHPSTGGTGDPELDKRVADSMRDADKMLCESRCKQAADCYGLNQRAH